MSKKIMMLIPLMKGGGAEKVASLLMNQLHNNGYDIQIILTSAKKEDCLTNTLKADISVSSLQDYPQKHKLPLQLLRVISSLICRMFELFSFPVPAFFAYLSFLSEYANEIRELRRLLKADPNVSVIAFLSPSIPIAMLAARGLPNKVIFSERGDPKRLMKKRYGEKFIKKYYKRADAAVFQTNDAKNSYPPDVAAKGVVIPNPVNGLPSPYFGERSKTISTFCRISKQKNLPLLAGAFADFLKDFPDYRLKIIGNANNADDEAALAQLKSVISAEGIGNSVDFLPFMPDVHSEIIRDSMYINSSDYEGMSNAMLESLAIGLPCVCTDCPIGGAASIIKNGENGILVPVADRAALCNGMKRIAGNKTFSDKLSRNGALIAEELSVKKIAEKWMELL